MTKNVILTGAGGEIAREIAKLFLKKGFFIYAIELKEKLLSETADILTNEGYNQFETIISDITDKKKITQSIEQIAQKTSINILINHVGVSSAERLEDTTETTWEKDIQTNLNGTFYCTNKVLEYMKVQRNGCIITIGSVNSDEAIACPAYSAAKAGLANYNQAIAMEYGQFNIRANMVSPGSVMTKAWDNRIKNEPKTYENILKWYPLKRLAKPIDIAKAILFLTESEAISGINLRVDAGLSAGNALFAQDITSCDFGV